MLLCICMDLCLLARAMCSSARRQPLWRVAVAMAVEVKEIEEATVEAEEVVVVKVDRIMEVAEEGEAVAELNCPPQFATFLVITTEADEEVEAEVLGVAVSSSEAVEV